MKLHLRIPRSLYDTAIADLERPHEYAGERVGFYFGRQGTVSNSEAVILLSEYFPVDETDYVDDPMTGARINSSAIRKTMQRTMDKRKGAFHVHLHSWKGTPSFSRTDRVEQRKLVQSLKYAAPNEYHGQIVFTFDQCAALVLPPQQTELISVSTISIVGSQFSFSNGGLYA